MTSDEMRDVFAMKAELKAVLLQRDRLASDLRSIAVAKRYNRDHFKDDDSFILWAQSRASSALADLEPK